jgi:hypothetical protein
MMIAPARELARRLLLCSSMMWPRERILANHERIRERLRGLLGHMTEANHGDLVGALAVAGDLTGLVKALAMEAAATAGLGSGIAAAFARAQKDVTRAAESLSYVFSVRVILECVAGIAQLLDDVEAALPHPPALAAS